MTVSSCTLSTRRVRYAMTPYDFEPLAASAVHGSSSEASDSERSDEHGEVTAVPGQVSE